MEQTKEHDSTPEYLHATGITSIDYLKERFFYLLWMRTRDEISAETASRWMIDFVSRAKEIHKLEIRDAYTEGHLNLGYKSAQDYINETQNTDDRCKCGAKSGSGYSCLRTNCDQNINLR